MSTQSDRLHDSQVVEAHLQPHLRNRKSVGSSINTSVAIVQQDIINQILLQQGANQEHRSENRMMKQIMLSEIRSKNFARRYGVGFRWQIDRNKTLSFDQWHNVPYDKEVLRCFNARTHGNFEELDGKFKHRIVKGFEGRWLYHASLMITQTVATDAEIVRLGFFKNGILYSTYAAFDTDIAGDNAGYVLDAVLHHTDLIAMKPGDVFEVKVFINTGNPPGLGSDEYIAPTSIQGSVLGFRMFGDFAEIGQTAVGTGAGFTFV